jgi:O-methyltransferase
MTGLKQRLSDLFRRMGYEVHKTVSFDPAMESEFREIAEKCKGYHLQSIPRLYALYQALCYIEKNKIGGAIAECGVYKGASQMVSGWVLKNRNSFHRDLYLYDTFDGWPEPGEKDRRCGDERSVPEIVEDNKKIDWKGIGVSMDRVRKNLLQTGYPEEKMIFVKGKVEETIPGTVPEKIALLRLDTDWYESTIHELKHLFPRLSPGGVLIIDDYGHWKGAKDAVDQYFSENKISMMLHRIDYTGRAGIKI